MASLRHPLVLILAGSGAVRAATLTLPANDTYLDNSNQGPTVDFSHGNYGHFGSIKAVLNSTGQGDFGVSAVHSAFTLPSSFFNQAPTVVASAVVEFLVRTNTLVSAPGAATDYAATAELHPLTHTFVAGDGGDPGKTRESGTTTAPNSPTPHGADWFTYDGVNAWTPGGSFDAISSPVATFRTVGSNQYADFDITALLNNPLTYAEIRDNGLLMKITQEGTPGTYPNVTLSLFSADTGSAGSLIFEVPEPASLSILAALGLAMPLRRRIA